MIMKKSKHKVILIFVLCILCCFLITYYFYLESSSFIELTKEQMYNDYKYLWTYLEENYPFFGVAKRAGYTINWENDLHGIEDCDNYLDFYNFVDDSIGKLKGIGHLSVVNYKTFEDLKSLFNRPLPKDIDVNPEPWLNIINNKDVNKVYNSIKKNLLNVDNYTYSKTKDSTNNLKTDIIKESKIAYIKIKSFGYEYIQQDSKNLQEFFKQVHSYDNIIIDITGNKGGNDLYWRDLLLLPNLKTSIKFKYYYLFNSSKDNLKFILANSKLEEFKDLDELPYMPNLNFEDLNNLTNFISHETELYPTNTPKDILEGKIWLLVDEDVYSSAETFAYICKNSGFATLVGKPTGGDGLGPDLGYFILPNSNLVIQYSYTYSINLDGSNNEEFGTIPDINSLGYPNYKTPLEACLSEIEKQQN